MPSDINPDRLPANETAIAIDNEENHVAKPTFFFGTFGRLVGGNNRRIFHSSYTHNFFII
ncbi:MAG: hypothetical protein WKG06_10460 [Segetibacter sp.]